MNNNNRHPISLYILFFTELWERFSYYGMKSILVLFLTSSNLSYNPGWNWCNSNAIMLVSWYTFLVHAFSIIGGICATYIFSPRIMVMIGCLLLSIGHIILILQDIISFYLGLSLIILGVGALKPNISTLVGNIYHNNDKNRNIGFSIFYMGINIGSLAGMIIVGLIGEIYNWHMGFGIAGLGMILGLLTYIYGQKYLIRDTNKNIIHNNWYNKKNYNIDKINFNNITLLIIFYLIIIIFYIACEQSSGLLTIYANEKINRLIDFNYMIYFILAINYIFILYIFFYIKSKNLFYWIVISSLLIINLYVSNIELIQYKIIIPASWLQACNALFILLLSIPVTKFWYWWNKNISDIVKMNVGILVMGIAYLFMVIATLQYYQKGYSSMLLLIIYYLLQTIAELCLAPIALSFITRIVPFKYISLMMGIFFAVIGFGGLIAGLVGSMISSFSELYIFSYLTIMCVSISIINFFILKNINKYFKIPNY